MRHSADVAVAVSSVGDGTGAPLGGDLLLAEGRRRPQLGVTRPRPRGPEGAPEFEVGGLDERGCGGLPGGFEGAQAVEIFLLEAAHLRNVIIFMKAWEWKLILTLQADV